MNKVSIAVAMIALSLVFAIAYTVIDEDKESRRQSIISDAQSTTEIFERDVKLTLGYADKYLTSARYIFEKNYNIEDTKRFVKNHPVDRSFFSHFTIIDKNGTPIFNSKHPLREGVSVLDRDYFKHFQSGEEDALLIPLPNVGRNSGKVILRIVRPYYDREGDFAGVMFIAADADIFVRFFDAFDYGTGASATLVGLDKRIRSRNSYGKLGPGQDISGSRIWREVAESPRGSYRQISVVDGMERIYTYRKLEEFPLIVALGLPLEKVDGEITDFQLAVYSLVIFVLMLTLLCGTMLIREQYHSSRILRSSQAKTEFLRHMSHELRTPLNSVIGFSDLMEQEIYGKIEPPRYAGYVANIRQSATHLLSLIENILDLVKIESGKREAKPTLLDPVTEIEKCLTILAPHIEAKHLKVHHPKAHQHQPILFDQLMFRQICLNLLSNAVKFSDDGGQVDIFIERGAPDILCMTFQDYGCGIDERDLKLIMEPFGQSRNNTMIAEERIGIGLGLPITKIMVESNGGQLELSSKTGSGTRVTIHVPIATG